METPQGKNSMTSKRRKALLQLVLAACMRLIASSHTPALLLCSEFVMSVAVKHGSSDQYLYDS